MEEVLLAILKQNAHRISTHGVIRVTVSSWEYEAYLWTKTALQIGLDGRREQLELIILLILL